ncbi:MAG TPA: hypothetical protein DCM87_06105 [Planctomycetes bacterium]|nr:hypothetical protein [Planctomycetota bacterium]
MARAWIYACFFVSGFSALVYEIVWSRLFVHTMGTSNLSITVVVAVFMGGLALGSALGGRIADRVESPLRVYAWLVIGVGLGSLAVFPLLRIASPVLGAVYRLNDGQPDHPFFTIAKALVCAASILLPTAFMGATLPVLARHVTSNLTHVGARLGALYGVNALGAVAGAAAAGFYLILRMGLAGTAVLAAALDILVGIAILVAHARARTPAPAHKGARHARERATRAAAPPSHAGAPAPITVSRAVRIVVIAYGVSGFVNMCLQLGWTRALVIAIGHSTYGFSVIVAIFILGLALGGWIAGLFADRLARPIAAFGWILVATAAASTAAIPRLGVLPARFASDMAAAVRSGAPGTFDFIAFMQAGALQAALVILPSTILMGMAFPIVGRVRALSPQAIGSAVGIAYASNTVGAILGTAITGFVLVPLAGRIWALLYLAAGAGLATGIAVLRAAPGGSRGRRCALAAAVIAALLGFCYATRPAGVLDAGAPPAPERARRYWNPAIFAQGSIKGVYLAHGFKSHDAYVEALLGWWDVPYYRDGEACSVAVLHRRADGHRSLHITGKADASAGESSFDLDTQLLNGHLPVLVHADPRACLNLGLGGGMSLGAMAAHRDVGSIDLLELSPEVVEAARLHFADVNGRALENPKVRTIIGDGRNHLAHTARRYDVISSEPSNFWIAGIGNLFTEEFHRIVRDRLRPGGVVCQWVYGYNIRGEDYATAVRTFLRVFPHVTVWGNSVGDTLLLASCEPVRIDRARVAEALAAEAVGSSLASIGIDAPEDLFRYFICDGAVLRAWAGEGAVNRDLFPILEFSSPLGYFDKDAEILAQLAAAAPGALPEDMLRGFSEEQVRAARTRLRHGRMLRDFFRKIGNRSFSGALDIYEALAAERDSWSLECAAFLLADRTADMGAERRAHLRRARGIHDTAALCAVDGYRPGPAAGDMPIVEHFTRLAKAAPPGRWSTLVALARVQLHANRVDDAFASIAAAAQRGAPEYKLVFLKGLGLGMRNELAAAEKLLAQALALAPNDPRAEKDEIAYNLAYCLEKLGKSDAAAAMYRRARDLGYNADAIRAAIERVLHPRVK